MDQRSEGIDAPRKMEWMQRKVSLSLDRAELFPIDPIWIHVLPEQRIAL